MKLSYLDISTAHLSHETILLLEKFSIGKIETWPPMTVAIYPEGAFVSVPPTGGIKEAQAAALIGGFPKDLADVLAYAGTQECIVVRFDAAAETIGDLPIFNWFNW